MTEISLPELRELPSLATASQIASILKCSRRHVLNECHAGRIEFVNIAGRFLITPQCPNRSSTQIQLESGITFSSKPCRARNNWYP